MRASRLWLLLWAALVVPRADAADKHNDLLRVVTPAGKTPVPAHPFVNLVVGLGFTRDGVPANPDTFRARLGRIDITPLFRRAVDERGNVVGMRAAAGPALIGVGRRVNRLRVDVRAAGSGRGGRARDVDRVRFRAVESDNHPPFARALAEGDVILPGVPLRFDGSESDDPDGDELSYLWDFGDGATSGQPRPEHTFSPQDVDATVRLTVSDGQASSTSDVTLFAVPPICPGCVPGILRIESSEALEFGPVAPGTSATRTLTIRNPDALPTSALAINIGLDNPTFTLSQRSVVLGPLQSTTLDITFTPGAVGHQGAQITLVAAARNQPVTRILAHGYGGSAPGTGPLPVSSPVFYTTFNVGTQGIFPDGTRFTADNLVHLCVVPGTGPGHNDFCVTDADCAVNGGTCPTTGTCNAGDNAGQLCTGPGNCPGGYCSASVYFDPEDMCGDGQGGLYLMSGDGTFTDPSLTRETFLSGSLLRLQFDGAGNRTASEILERTTEATTQVACDGIRPESGGRVYEAEFHNLEAPGDCFRDAREALKSLRKTGGGETVLMPRIDTAFGIPECEDFEPVTDLQATRDASALFASGALGLFRIRPTSLFITPDWDDIFDLHPDGSVVLITITNRGPTGLLQVYKISPDQALTGAQLLKDLTPCVTVALPNNRGPDGRGGLALVGSAVERVSSGSFDATILANFFSGGAVSGANPALSPNLGIRGTIAIASPAASNLCTNLGLVNLEILDYITF